MVLLLAHVEDLSDVDDAEKLPARHGRGDVIEMGGAGVLGDEAVAALNQPRLITRRPVPPTQQLEAEPLPAAALVRPTKRLPAMRFKPHAL